MTDKQIKITYKPLWKLLIDREISKTELRKNTKIAPSTFTKMNNDQQVSLDVLARICIELKCGFDDIKNMSYQYSLHTNTDNLHFHLSFTEKKPNYKRTFNKELVYRLAGKLDQKDLGFLKNELGVSSERT